MDGPSKGPSTAALTVLDFAQHLLMAKLGVHYD